MTDQFALHYWTLVVYREVGGNRLDVSRSRVLLVLPIFDYGKRMTGLVLQSKKIARRRKTNVIAIAEMAVGTIGAWT